MDNAPVIRVAVLSPDAAPRLGYIERSDRSLREAVGGEFHVFTVHPFRYPQMVGSVLIANKNGLAATPNQEATYLGIVTGGTVVVCSLSARGYGDITQTCIDFLKGRCPDLIEYELNSIPLDGDSNASS